MHVSSVPTTYQAVSDGLEQSSVPRSVNMSDFAESNVWNLPGTAEAYSAFASAGWYSEIVSHMVSLVPQISSGSTVVDLGSGTGAGSRGLATHIGPESRVIGIDRAISQVEFARAMNSSSQLSIEYRVGALETIARVVPEGIEGMVAFNSIHLLGKLKDVLASCANKLERNGFLAFCTGYSTGMYDAEVGAWVMRSFSQIMEIARLRFPEQMASGQSGIESQKNVNLVSLKSLNRNLETTGFVLENMKLLPALLPMDTVIDFLVMPGIGNSVLPESIPLDERRNLIASVLEDPCVPELSRNWCYVVARKK